MDGDRPKKKDEASRIVDEVRQLPAEQRDAIILELGSENADFDRPQEPHHSSVTKTRIDQSRSSESLTTEFLPDSWIGRRIGPYQLVQQLGRGGMGAVFLGKRADGQFEQDVAVKIIKRGVMSKVTLRRFFAERQILARLQHPNIARLLDGGLTSDGVPYFVMTYIQGETVLDYCEHNNLKLFQRLELFKQVCDAVQYAHRNLIVHRDLKPGNILVTQGGQVKLLDFGIAKLLDEGSSALRTELTQSGQMVATPAYASPEQLKGGPVSTSADVYALGLLLFEMLTGQHAFDVADKRQFEVMKVLLHEEPQKPSTALTSKTRLLNAGSTQPDTLMGVSRKRLSRMLKGDLDTICLKALQKEPERRYLSVEQMVDDVNRFLGGRPVLARPDRLGYRISKFVVRNSLAVFSSTVILVLLLVFSGVTALQSSRISRQSERIAQERDKAEATAGFLTDLFRHVDPNDFRGEQLSARALLDQGVQKITLTLKDQEDLQAELMCVIGQVYMQLGLFESAKPLLQRSLDLRKNRLGPEHREIGESLFALGSYYLGIGELEKAEDFLSRAVQMNEKLEGRACYSTMEFQSALGTVYKEQGLYPRAEALFREVLEFYQSEQDEENESFRATAMNQLASVRQAQGAFSEAEKLYLQSLQISRDHLGDFHPKLAISLNNLGTMYSQMGDAEKAQPYLREALEILERTYGENPNHPSIISTMNNLAGVVKKMGQLRQAEKLYRDVLQRTIKQFGEEHMYVAGTKNNLALTLGDLGDVESAQRFMVEGLDQYKRILGADHPNVGIVNVNFGNLLLSREKFDDSIPFYEEGAQILTKSLGADHPNACLARRALGKAFIRARRLPEAQNLFLTELDREAARHPAGSLVTMEILGFLAQVFMARGDWEQGRMYLENAETMAHTIDAPKGLGYADIQVDLGKCLLHLNQLDRAESALKKGYAIHRKELADDDPSLVEDRNLLAELAQKQNQKP